MMKKLKVCKTLTGRKKTSSPKLTAKQVELAQVENEIERLLDTLTGATPVLISYANAKIEELDSRRQALTSEIAKLTAEAVSPEQIDTISGYLDDWENVSFEDKQQVVDLMITVIRATIGPQSNPGEYIPPRRTWSPPPGPGCTGWGRRH